MTTMKYDDILHPALHIDGWMSHAELDWLYEQALKCHSIVEIGSWCGRSTYALLSGCKGTVYAIDHFNGSPDELKPGLSHYRALTDDIYSEFMNNVGHFPNLQVIRGDSVEAAARFPDNSIDMVFIDGCHAYESVKADLAAWGPKTSFLCGHDRHEGGVPVALDECIYHIDQTIGSLWVANGLKPPGPGPAKIDVTIDLPGLIFGTDGGLQ